jgi:membrane-associated protein
MEWISYFVDLFLHLDVHLEELVQQFDSVAYVLLFLVIFCETGLVVTPFLPGDSLLFAAGALAAKGWFNPHLLFVSLTVAAIIGDTVNYWIGAYIGPRAFTGKVRFLKKEYLDRTHRFYERHGGKTIILARFIPIIRTFAPFVAGIGAMNYTRFIIYNVTGAIVWVAGFIYVGFFFGNLPWVKDNFSLVIMGIIVVSVLPIVVEYVRTWLQGAESSNEVPQAEHSDALP